MKFIPCIVMSFFVLGCQWVKPTEQGKNVSLVKEAHVESCKKLGSTESNVADNVGIIRRGDKKIAKELIVLAKNQAAKMGGDTIVALNAAENGSQKFGIYTCKR